MQYSIKDRECINTEIVHFYANKMQKIKRILMHAIMTQDVDLRTQSTYSES